MANLKFKDQITGQWISLSTVRGPKGDNADITLNGTTSLNASFYAPVNSGTSGQMLVSRGSGEAPQWTAQPIMTPVYNATLSIKKNNTTVGTFTANASQNASVNIEVPTNNDILNLIYPINSIYVTLNNTNPDTLFPGTHWEQIQDRFLLSAGSNYNAGNTGGNDTHTHNYSHTHGVPGVSHNHALSDNGYAKIVMHGSGHIRYKELNTSSWSANYKMGTLTYGSETYSESWGAALGGTTDNKTPSATTTNSQSTTTTESGSNMPPYLVVYMWKRIS